MLPENNSTHIAFKVTLDEIASNSPLRKRHTQDIIRDANKILEVIKKDYPDHYNYYKMIYDATLDEFYK